MTHLQETLINRPYGTGRVFFLFFQALRARLPSFESLRDKRVRAPPRRCDKLALTD
jgi:hypothetical protein